MSSVENSRVAAIETTPKKKIGSVLLGNWVEERAVENLLLSEQDFRLLSRQGHKELLNHNAGDVPAKDKFKSTNKSDYQQIQEDITKKKGPRELKEERELLERAQKACEKPKEVLTTKDWVSVTRGDFYESKTIKSFLGDPSLKPESVSKTKETPITFWNTNSGASTSGFYATNYGPDLTFKRSAAFSCPISEYLKGEVKDL